MQNPEELEKERKKERKRIQMHPEPSVKRKKAINTHTFEAKEESLKQSLTNTVI